MALTVSAGYGTVVTHTVAPSLVTIYFIGSSSSSYEFRSIFSKTTPAKRDKPYRRTFLAFQLLCIHCTDVLYSSPNPQDAINAKPYVYTSQKPNKANHYLQPPNIPSHTPLLYLKTIIILLSAQRQCHKAKTALHLLNNSVQGRHFQKGECICIRGV